VDWLPGWHTFAGQVWCVCRRAGFVRCVPGFAGRLIRDETDRGVLMVCDPRLVDKPYGKRIWQSLPPMKRTREIADVESFFGS
jgi:hypothetical protein